MNNDERFQAIDNFEQIEIPNQKNEEKIFRRVNFTGTATKRKLYGNVYGNFYYHYSFEHNSEILAQLDVAHTSKNALLSHS